MPRIACLWIPDLPLCAAVRAEPRLACAPLAVVQAGDLGGRAHVLGAAPLAEGVEAGQTLAEARAVCPALVHRQTSPERERAAAHAALEAAAAISPRCEEAAPGLVYLDADGLSRLFGDDRGVARALVAAAERVGLRAAVGVAAGKSVALLAARAAAPDLTFEPTPQGVGGGAFRVVAPEEQAAFLAGLHTLGEVSRLPPGPLSARLGPEGAVLWRLAKGDDGAALAPRPQPVRFEEGEELEWDAQSIEPLLFLWKALLDRLAQRLRARGLMARELLLRLRLADGSWDDRTVDLAAPSREVGPLLQLLRLLVEGRPPAAGVTAVRLCAVSVPEVLDQLPLFGPRGASPVQLAAAVARLSALVGPERVGQPVVPDRWTPFAAEVARFAPPPPPAMPEVPPAAPLELVARALRPPRTAEVRCDGAGRPLLVIGEGALGGRVVASAGPWRTVAEWWTDAPVALDSYDLEVAGGLLLRASRELSSGAWWIEAVYD
jgi:protein ImuB